MVLLRLELFCYFVHAAVTVNTVVTTRVSDFAIGSFLFPVRTEACRPVSLVKSTLSQAVINQRLSRILCAKFRGFYFILYI